MHDVRVDKGIIRALVVACVQPPEEGADDNQRDDGQKHDEKVPLARRIAARSLRCDACFSAAPGGPLALS